MQRNREAGQALILAVLALGLLLMGFVGLGIDVGYLRYEKRLQQAAADSAAIAGASDLPDAGSGISDARAAAAAAAATSGYSDNAGANNTPCGTSTPIGCVTVKVNIGPKSGPHSGQPNSLGYVEVYVAATYSTFFMRVLGVPNATVTARAVATNVSGGANSGCLYTLGNPSSSIEGVNIQGSAELLAPNCGIVDNGNFNTKGNKLIVTADTFGIAGDWSKSGPGGTVTCTGSSTCPVTNLPSAGDPLSSLSPPCSPCSGGSAAVAVNRTFSPGTYSSISVGPGSFTFNPGLYIIDGSGGLSIGANATVTGTGVTFYFTNGSTVNMVGTPTIQLTAPGSSGQYPGILFYQDPNDTSGPSMGGNSSSFYDGVLYFPKALVTFFGNGSIGDVAIVVADAIALNGNPTVNLQGVAGLPPGVSVITNAVLVE